MHIAPLDPETPDETIRLHLSDGTAEGQANAPRPQPATRPLSAAETQRLLERLAPLELQAADQQEFARRADSLPPPITGSDIRVQPSFPAPEPPALAEIPATGPLEVLRYAPVGEVPLAPNLSVTFSQPMVAVTDHAATQATIPVTITPAPPGQWRWVGSQTLLFEPAGRFPMATSYRVEIPAGTPSALGDPLPAALSWTFATPPLTLITAYPDSGPHRRDQLILLAFDQQIEVEALSTLIEITAGSRRYAARLAEAQELASAPEIQGLIDRHEPGRWLVLRTVELLPADSAISVTVPAGAPSAEGPLTTTKVQSFGFRTYGPLTITEQRCGWGRQASDCPPWQPWSIVFSNPLDIEQFDQSQVQIEPELLQMTTSIYDNTLNIQGASSGRTTYTVRLAAELADQFGQTLGEHAPVIFKVGPAPQALLAPGESRIVLDPFGPPRYMVYSVNHPALIVRLYVVGPEEWSRFDGQDKLPGTCISTTTIELPEQPDALIETAIDLTPVLSDGFAQCIVQVEPATQPKEAWRRQQIKTWIQVTELGLTAFADRTETVVWATSLRDGRPLEGVNVMLHNPAEPAVAPIKALFKALLGQPATSADGLTGADGLARLPVFKPDSVLVAGRNADLAILPMYTWGLNHDSISGLRWFVFDDRAMYRPGEEIHIKGWARYVNGSKGGDVQAGLVDIDSLESSINDSRGNQIWSGRASISPAGGFDLAVTLPATMNLGHATLLIGPKSAPDHQHTFQVQEFRRPEFEVTARPGPGPHLIDQPATATVQAAYYAGGGLPDAEVTWNVNQRTGSWSPPGWSEFTFGIWRPWWLFEDSGDQSSSAQFSARTDAAGQHTLQIKLAGHTERPISATAEATVLDVNRQAWTATSTLLIHPATLYVGLRTKRTFVQAGTALAVELIVVDLDGQARSGQAVQLQVAQIKSRWSKGRWREEETSIHAETLTSGPEPLVWSWTPETGGSYRIRASVADETGRRQRSQLTVWVAGTGLEQQRVEQDKVNLIPDRQTYQPGETAEILVQAPFLPAEGTLTIRRSGILEVQRFRMEQASWTARIPITDAHLPNLYVQIDLVGAAPRLNDAGEPDPALPPRPAFASNNLNLAVPPLKRALLVQVQPRDQALEPGGATAIDLLVQDRSGAAVAGSEIAVVVVDEAILALTGYQLGPALATFYPERPQDVVDGHSRSALLLAKNLDLAQMEALAVPPPMPPPMMMRSAAPAGGGAPTGMLAMAPPEADMRMGANSREGMEATIDMLFGAEGGGGTPIAVRSDFNPLALFAPVVKSAADGRASVVVKLPDNLTRYRIMAVAVAGQQFFGSGEAALTARLPIMVRPSPPRFLNFGDRCELPVVVQNQTDQPLEVAVVLRATNLELPTGAGQRVEVPANDRVEVRFPVATVQPGTARFQVGIAAGGWADAAEGNFPIWTPATTEAFATYGELDAGAISQPVARPANVFPQFGGIEITSSATAVQALTDAVLYLTNYPFECAEQLASRILAVAALRDVLSAFAVEQLPAPEIIVKSVDQALVRLQSMQNNDGGFSFWQRDEESWPFVSIHAAHALQRAQEKGFATPSGTLERAGAYLRSIEQRIPEPYNQATRAALIAYALFVRQRMGDSDPQRANQLISEHGIEQLSLEALGWLLSVISKDPGSRSNVAAIRQHLTNRVSETAANAHFTSSYGDSGYLILHSNRRTDGVLLDALITDQPRSALIPKLVRGLLAQRTKGHWGSTQDNVFILLALDHYFATYEQEIPDFQARAWLGEQFAGQHHFQGRTTERHHINIPMALLTGEQPLVLSKTGPGRMYYRIGMRYAPTRLKLEPVQHGFTVERSYAPVDDPADVQRDEAAGTWQIKAGALVRVRLTLVAPARRYHVALVDPLPAGLEAQNPALAVTASQPADPAAPSARRWWWSRWYQHENLRDERVEVFTALLWEGVHTYSYIARATTPGTFVVPPVRAEEMYHPETFGRGTSDLVVVE